MIIHITKDNFFAEVIESGDTVLLDFWAPWCGPCRMMSAILDEVTEEMPSAKIGKINVDEESELASQFVIMSIPTFVLFKDGKPAQKFVGGRDKEDIIALFD